MQDAVAIDLGLFILTGLEIKTIMLLREPFFQGMRAILTSLPGVIAWALATGIGMAKLGLTVWQALGMSFLVYAGSAQLAALPLLMAGTSLWTVLLTAAIVNLRFVVFSVILQPHFKHLSLLRRLAIAYMAVDITFILFNKRFSEETDPTPLPEKEAYFYGVASLNWLAWHGAATIGILFAQSIPENWGMELAGTLVLLALFLPLIATRVGILAGLTAALVALLTYPLPYKLNLILAVLSAVAVGVLAEERAKHKKISAISDGQNNLAPMPKKLCKERCDE